MSDISAKELFANHIGAHLAGKNDLCDTVNAIYQFVLDGDGGGNFFISLLKGGAPETGEGLKESPNCTITMKAADFAKMILGQANAQMLFMQGKLKVKGDMGLALKLQKVIPSTK